MGAIEQLRAVADETPASRERHVDLTRAVSIFAVVLGHWFATGVTQVEEGLDGVLVLGVLEWTHPLSWLFQVMPLFFLIGGYANAAAWESHEREGGDALGWVLGRYDRLLRPTTVLIAVLAVSVVVARAAGVEHADAATAAWFATVPLWFLVAYLGTVALAPWMLRAHRRWKLAVPVALLAVVAAGDVSRLVLDLPLLGQVNFLAAWLAIHQLGFSWRDGRLPARPRVGAALAASGLLALVLLTVVGPYPISMVGVPGEDIQNTSPPTVALLALAVAQTGVVLGLRDALHGWLHRRRVWMGVVAVNAVILTVFLWHMAAAMLVAIVVYPRGLLPVVPIDTTAFLWLRVPWVGACLVVLAVLVGLLGAIERSVPGSRKGARLGSGVAAAVTWAGLLATLTGMLFAATAGRGVHGPLGLPTEAFAFYGAGVVLLAAVARRAFRTGRASPA